MRFEKFTHIRISFLAFQKEFLKSPNGSEVILQTQRFLKSPSNSEVILFLAFYKSKDAAKFNIPFLNCKDLKISEQQRGKKSKTQNFSHNIY
ncbi:hypothetical protein MSIBF_A680002 [groundwater metagenome]|uniref:Uncharacterized protein n=1 Tax=groundwater metagenome TaxID=717931 RepID=A0A098EEH6_9ZZZZ